MTFDGYEVKYGVLLDEKGSIDIFDTRRQAVRAWDDRGGEGIVKITTEWG